MSWGRSSAIHHAAAVARMRATPMGRRHLILVFTEGVDDASVIRKEQLLAIAGRADAVMHVSKRKTALEIAQERHLKGPVINVQYSDLLWPQEPGVIGDAARRTGGGVLNSLGGSKYEALSDIIARLRESYLIRYQPRGVAPGGWHDIRVTVPGQRYDIQARKGYWGG